MLQAHKNAFRNSLRLAASVCALSAAFALGATSARADTITLDSSTSPYDIQSGEGNTVVVPSGTAAYLTASYNSIPDGYEGIVWDDTANFSSGTSCAYNGDSTSCYTGVDTIEVEEGATIYVDNPWWWQVYQSVFDVEGDVTFAHGGTYLTGSNTFAGDVTLEDSATVSFGVSWAYATTTFGEDTDFVMGSGTELDFYEPNTVENTVSTISSSDSTAWVFFYNGTMIVNGVNTSDSAYYGRVLLNAGATFMVGDSDHSDAVFGDPTGYATIISVAQSGGTLSTLSGYGTIDGTVYNGGYTYTDPDSNEVVTTIGGIVHPGGDQSVAGTLTINGDYNQDSNGELVIDVTPTGASELVVNGTATLDGALVLNIEDGTYSNAIYTIVSADSLSGELTLSDVSSSSAIVGVITGDDSYQLVVEKASGAQSFGHMMTANRHFVEGFTRALYDEMDFNSAAAGEKADRAGGFSGWMQPYGRIDNVGRGGLGYYNRTVGVMGGVEYRQPGWNDAIIGGAFTYGHSSMDISGEDSHVGSDAYALALYGGAQLLNARVDGTVFYNSFYGTAMRHMGEDYGTAQSKPDGWSYGVSFQVSQNVFDNFLEPFVRGIFARNHTDSTTESGSDYFDLSYSKIDKDTFIGDMGFRLHILTPSADQKLKLTASLSVQHDFSGMTETTSGGFADIEGSTFTYSWKGNSENALLAGVDLGGNVYPGLEIYGRLSGQFTANQRSGELSFGGRYRF